MCGNCWIHWKQTSHPIILNGLKRLEYRGYDSAGIAIYDGAGIQLSKTKGKVSDLEKRVKKEIKTTGTLGIGHTRWSHPRGSQRRELAPTLF